MLLSLLLSLKLDKNIACLNIKMPYRRIDGHKKKPTSGASTEIHSTFSLVFFFLSAFLFSIFYDSAIYRKQEAKVIPYLWGERFYSQRNFAPIYASGPFSLRGNSVVRGNGYSGIALITRAEGCMHACMHSYMYSCKHSFNQVRLKCSSPFLCSIFLFW